jgi:hypothetical protein
MDDQSERRARAGQNQSLFRQVNERVEILNQAFDPLVAQGEWVCECADMSCVEQIEMSLAEYTALRADGNTFAVKPGHEVLDVETVVRATDRYVVVSKLGVGADVAHGNDPRAGANDQASTV